MINTAIVFSSGSIQLLQLDVSKKTVVTAVSVNIPPQIVERGVIINRQQLTAYLQKLIAAKQEVIEKVIIIIPEDTVISKSLELPKLPSSEIDEAVNWEAERFLPYSKDTAVLDWKRLAAGDQLHILFKAVPESLVNLYIEIFQEIGVEVEAIETPALALVRLTGSRPGTRLLIYVSKFEAILTLAKDQEVVATSLLPVTKDLHIVLPRTINSMMNYYQKFPLDWIQIGGVGVTSGLVKAITALNIQVTGFALPIAVKPDIANQYLLEISSVLSPATPPSDQNTINMLPKWYVKQQKYKKLYYFWKRYLVSAFIYFSLVAIVVLGVWGWLRNEKKTLENQQATVSNVARDSIQAVSLANQLSKQAITLETTDFFPLKIVNSIEKLANENIKLAGITIDAVDEKGLIVGVAKDRLSMLAYKQAIESLPQVKQVQLPVSSFVVEVDIPFQMNFILNKEFVKLETIKE